MACLADLDFEWTRIELSNIWSKQSMQKDEHLHVKKGSQSLPLYFEGFSTKLARCSLNSLSR